jgi:hypothetical protein
MEYMEVLRVQHNKQEEVERYQQFKTEQPKAHAARLEHRAEQEVERYRQLKTDKPKAYAAKLDAAAVSKKKKKQRQKPACPGSAHGLAQPCTECNSVCCYST